MQDGSNRSRTSQRGTSQTGDAIGGGQVVGAAGTGNVDLNATNDAVDSSAESGDASGSNEMSGVFVGNQSTGTDQGSGSASADTLGTSPDGNPHPVGALGPVAPVAETQQLAASVAAVPSLLQAAPRTAGALELAGPPGPIGPIATDVSGAATNVQDGDNVLSFSQRADVHTGAAVAGGQVVGTVQNGGNATITLSNRATNSQATTGNGQMDNTLRNVRVGSLNSGGSAGSPDAVGALGPLVPEDLQVATDPAPTTSDASAAVLYPPDIQAAIRAIDAAVGNSATFDSGGAVRPG